MKLAIYGYGGHAREIASLIGRSDVVFFTDTAYTVDETVDIKYFHPSEYELIVAVGDSNARQQIVEKLPIETKYASFIHPSTIISGNVVLGEGCYVGPCCILTDNITIGKHAILNRGVQIGHDSNIGDYFSAMPGSTVSGNVYIGDRVYLGTNSSIREKISICNDCTFGLNSGIVENISNKGTYVGTPAKLVSK